MEVMLVMRKFGFEDDGVFYDIAVKADQEKIEKLIARAKIGDDQSLTELIDLIIFEKEVSNYLELFEMAALKGNIKALKAFVENCIDRKRGVILAYKAYRLKVDGSKEVLKNAVSYYAEKKVSPVVGLLVFFSIIVGAMVLAVYFLGWIYGLLVSLIIAALVYWVIFRGI
ncbi:MAG: hypothetical protein EOL98_01400 [Negativicutes bacterium]|nr:hypothetical protein [Negativicutes bacterium]